MYTELLDKFRGAIKEAMPHLKEEKIAYKVINRQLCIQEGGGKGATPT